MKFFALALLLSMTGASAFAQHKGKLPDSVSTIVEELPPMKEDQPSSTQAPLADSATVAEEDTVENEAASKDSAGEEARSLRTVPDSVLTRQRMDPDFAYANDPSYWKQEEEKKKEEDGWFLKFLRILASKGFRYFIYIVMGGLLLYVLYRIIAENNLGFFYRRSRRVKKTEDVRVEELPEEDLDDLLKAAMDAGEYRPAVRYMYLKTLRMMEDAGWIQYHIQATGQDYLRQMAGHAQESRFRTLQSAYERVWYGEFPIDGTLFGRLRDYYSEYFKTAGRSI